MGGFVASLIALPYGLALASLMGLPPILGVYTSILTAPMLVLFGRNPVLIGGTASVTVPFIASAFARQGLGGAAKVSIVASIFMLCFCVMKLGRHVTKLPLAVVSGFSCGIGAMMIVSQLDTIFGLHVDHGGAMILQVFRVFENLGDTDFASLCIGVVVIVVSAAARRKYPVSPAPLIGVIAGAAIAAVFGWKGMELGALQETLPPFVGFAWAPRDVYEVLPQAFALAVVTSVNLLVTSRVVEHFRGTRSRLKQASADAELGAYSMANLFGGMFGAPMSVGIPARSLANIRCGGRTRMSNLLHAVFLVGFIFFAKDWIEGIPMPALAGVTAWMGLALLDWSTWRRLHLMRREEAASFVITAGGVLMMNAVVAIALGYSIHLLGKLLLRDQPSPAAAAGEPLERTH